jgi:hypothetical protein
MRTTLWTLLLWTVLLLARLPSQASGNELEDWYTYWGGGWSDVHYPQETQTILDLVQDLPGSSNLTLNLDLLGFYWPHGDNRLWGVIANAFGDTHEAGGRSLDITGVTYALSGMTFLTDRIGRGPFLRGDIGPSRIIIDSPGGKSTNSDWGLGLLGGIGFGQPLTQGSRLLVQINYALRRVEGENYKALSFSLGGMW